jgi:hypothetical protein
MKQSTCVAKVVNGGIASRNGIRIRLCDLIQRSVVHAEPPNKIRNIFNILLVRFWCKHNLEHQPGTTARMDPIIIEKGLDMLHRDV